MWDFKSDSQHLELHLEGSWKPVQLTQESCNMGEPRNTQCRMHRCILDQAQLLSALQGKLHIKHNLFLHSPSNISQSGVTKTILLTIIAHKGSLCGRQAQKNSGAAESDQEEASPP